MIEKKGDRNGHGCMWDCILEHIPSQVMWNGHGYMWNCIFHEYMYCELSNIYIWYGVGNGIPYLGHGILFVKADIFIILYWWYQLNFYTLCYINQSQIRVEFWSWHFDNCIPIGQMPVLFGYDFKRYLFSRLSSIRRDNGTILGKNNSKGWNLWRCYF